MSGLEEKLTAVRSFLKEKFTTTEVAPSRLFANPEYPHQFEAPTEAEYADGNEPIYLGELRGFYPDLGHPLEDRVRLGFFQPYNSMYHGKDVYDTVDSHRSHSGVDIFTPFLPYPLEVPVYALVAGQARVWTRDRNLTNGQYQKLGNRVRLFFDVKFGEKKLKCAFDYGHLSRFAPGLQPGTRDRKPSQVLYDIKAGDLIGYAGKSGNGDDSHEATTRTSPFKVSACHLHLGFVMDDVNRDPLEVLPKPLALQPDQGALNLEPPKTERHTRIKISQWVENQQPDLQEEQIAITFPEGRLSTYWNAPLRRRLKTGTGGRPALTRAILPKPFSALDFDHTLSLGDTLDAFNALGGRTDAEYAAGLKKHQYVLSNQGDEPEADRWHETVWALSWRAQNTATSMISVAENTEPAVQPKNAAKAVLALIHLVEAAWMFLGGPAFAESTPGRMQPACGFGLYGDVRALAMPEGVAGIHRSSFMAKDWTEGAAEDAVKAAWALSLTFGSGSLRHAVFCESAVATAPESIKPYVAALEPALIPTVAAFDLAYRRFRALRVGEKAAVDAFKTLVTEAANNARDLAEIADFVWDAARFKAYAQHMATHNAAALTWAFKKSLDKETTDSKAFSPEVKGLGLIVDRFEETV